VWLEGLVLRELAFVELRKLLWQLECTHNRVDLALPRMFAIYSTLEACLCGDVLSANSADLVNLLVESGSEELVEIFISGAVDVA
jgi:hypothetical protein